VKVVKRLGLFDLRDFVQFLAIGPVLASGTAALAGAAIYKVVPYV
jgi:hypothetical protein